jgi:methylated-DNA-[protein]-cysteine S-methyltransferase
VKALPEPDSFSARLPAPFAVLGVRTAGGLLTGIECLPQGANALAPLNRVAEQACRQLERYLEDPEYRFDLPLEYRGSAFQCRVWRALHAIPCGATLSYGELAGRLGTAPRPVGAACGANRIPIVIPCHRVVARAGLGGFMNARGGFALEIKRWLLRHEGARL